MRPSTACRTCRSRRRRCVSNGPREACEFCKRRRYPCSITFTSLSAAQSPDEAHKSDEELVLPPYDVCEDLIRLYFLFIHDTSQWLFHRPTFMDDFKAGTLPRAILVAMISLSARFSAHSYFSETEPRKRGEVYAKEAESLLRIRDISMNTIQLCLILGAYFSTEGEAASEAMYYGIACRTATIMGLSVQNMSNRLERELVIRTLWTLVMCDIWSSSGNCIPRMFPPEPCLYPMDEVSFSLLRRDDTNLSDSLPQEVSRISLLAEMFKVNSIFAEVANAITAAVSQRIPDEEHMAMAGKLSAKLEDWCRDLHPRLKDTQDNLEYHCHSGTGHMFVALYLGYYHFGQLLYYKFLHNARNDLEVGVGELAARCKANSAGLCDLLYRAYTTPGAEVYYTMVGHVLVVSSTVQLYNLLFSTNDWDISAARNRLEKNFRILSELQVYWPTLDNALTRFREFHQACKDAKESTFQMDEWMLRFLLAFSKPVGSKPPDPWTDVWRELSLASPQEYNAYAETVTSSPTDPLINLQSSGQY